MNVRTMQRNLYMYCSHQNSSVSCFLVLVHLSVLSKTPIVGSSACKSMHVCDRIKLLELSVLYNYELFFIFIYILSVSYNSFE